ncbi:MAG: hypothetical protein ACYTGB_08940, partial [Planctomycetota bacterium]
MSLALDYTNFLAGAIGPEHGLTAGDLAAGTEAARAACEKVKAERGTGWLRWTLLPGQTEMADRC